MKKKVLVVIAHPDDETIWIGGLLWRERDRWDVRVVCLCRGDDEDRSPKFYRVCKELGVRSFISDLDDEKMGDVDSSEVVDRIKGFLKDDLEYDYVFTHGGDGEYGHKRHIDVHKAVVEMVKHRDLIAGKILFFSYLKKENDFQGYCIYNSNANIFIKLNSEELLMKKRLIQEFYGYLKGGFEEKSCGEIESFDVFRK